MQYCLERGSGVTDDSGRCRGATIGAVRGRQALEGHKSYSQKESLSVVAAYLQLTMAALWVVAFAALDAVGGLIQ